MFPYKNLTGKSGILKYEIGDDYIIVEFKKVEYIFYVYTYESSGIDKIEKMKELAILGKGLNSYISKFKPKFDKKY
ncbi:MAG: hypothetical protein WC850_05110 [Candidatus Gracilibacteria bacterium]